MRYGPPASIRWPPAVRCVPRLGPSAYLLALSSSSQLPAGLYMSCWTAVICNTLPWVSSLALRPSPCPQSCCTVNIAASVLPPAIAASSGDKKPRGTQQDAAKSDCEASEWKPWRCLCLGLFLHVTNSTPRLRTVVQCLHKRFTEARTFILALGHLSIAFLDWKSRNCHAHTAVGCSSTVETQSGRHEVGSRSVSGIAGDGAAALK